jgi:FkbM family methyltransferase
MKVIDIGMYNGADTRYYLESGHDVIAIEANPALCEAARERFGPYLKSGQLQILNVAVCNHPGPVELKVLGRDLGASSINSEAVRFPLGSFSVAAKSLPEILQHYGKTDFIKVDIEGSDRECVLSLTPETAPRYLSFEAPAEIDDLIGHLARIGYRRFKVIQQTTFRSLPRQARITDRVTRRLIRTLGYDQPRYVKRHGKFFLVEHSAGPPPWESDGRWESADEVSLQWRQATKCGVLSSWYDVHTAR